MSSEDLGRVAAFFDLDLTITDTDSFRIFLKHYYAYDIRKAHYTFFIFLAGLARKIRAISLRTFKERALIGLKGLSEEQIKCVGKEIFDHALKSTIREKALERIAWHKRNGDLVYIVTASPDIYVRAFADYLDCDGYICTELNYRKGLFTGEIKGDDCIGNEKSAKVMKIAKMKGIDLTRSVAYSDHEVDIHLLEQVGNAVAVSPTPKMEEESRKRKWVVEKW